MPTTELEKSPRNAITETFESQAQHLLVGRQIVDARYMTREESEFLGWHGKSIVLLLDNGTIIFPARDAEGNGAAALQGQGVETFTFPII